MQQIQQIQQQKSHVSRVFFTPGKPMYKAIHMGCFKTPWAQHFFSEFQELVDRCGEGAEIYWLACVWGFGRSKALDKTFSKHRECFFWLNAMFDVIFFKFIVLLLFFLVALQQGTRFVFFLLRWRSKGGQPSRKILQPGGPWVAQKG